MGDYPLPATAISDLIDERVLALAAVLAHKQGADDGKPTDPDYFLRMVFRWYGRTFSMSPHEVAELPLVDVVRHYWEDYYQKMVDDDQEASVYRHAEAILEDPDKRREREGTKSLKDAQDRQWHEEVEKKEQAQRAVVAKKAEVTPKEVLAKAMAAMEECRIVFGSREDDDALGSTTRPPR